MGEFYYQYNLRLTKKEQKQLQISKNLNSENTPKRRFLFIL